MIRRLDSPAASGGFEVTEAGTLEDLFDGARRALLMTMLERPPERGERERVAQLSAPDLETLLARWIDELACFVRRDGFVPVRAELRIRGTGEESFSLHARLAGAPLDLEGHGRQGEVESATSRGVDMTSGNGRWYARVLLES